MKDDGRIPRIKDTDMTDRLLTAGVPRHVLARWQSQCGGTSHHTHRGAVQERAGPSTPPIMGRCRDLRAGWRFSSVTAG